MSFKISWKIHLLCFVMSLLFCLLGQEFIYTLFEGVMIENRFLNFTGNLLLDQSLFLFMDKSLPKVVQKFI